MATVEKQNMVCNACGHRWQDELLWDVPISVWLAWVKGLYCPECGADHHKLSFADGFGGG